MDLYNNLERADSLLTRLYGRRKRWMWGVLLAPFILLFAWIFLGTLWGGAEGGVTLIVHSKIERPILGFSVNGVAGTNTSAYEPNNPSSGSGTNAACCGVIKGKNAEVTWTLSVTGPQYEAGMRLEKHRIVTPLPERKRGENDLHVHFLPGDKVLLVWSDNAWSPYDKHNPKNESPAL